MSNAASSHTGQRLLMLVPTAFELAALPADSVRRWREAGAVVELCGLGPVTAAAVASQLIARLEPQRVVLIGIAGAYDAADGEAADTGDASNGHLVVGHAYEFTTVASHGLGVGEGPKHRSAAELGWDERFQLPQARGAIALGPSSGAAPAGAATTDRLLLSVYAASADRREAASRQHRYPDAVAEDMESYAVAVACRLAGVTLRVIRGISNVAGDRDFQNWRIETALAHASRFIEAIDCGLTKEPA